MTIAGEVVTKSAYAQHAGITKGRVTQLTKPGQLLHEALTPDNKIRRSVADRLRLRHLDGANVNAKLPAADDGAGDGDEEGELPAGGALANGTQAGLTEAKLRSAELDVTRKQLEIEKERGRLVDKEALLQQVSEDLQLFFEGVRSAGRNLAERLAHDELIGAEKTDAVARALGDELGKLIEDWRHTLQEADGEDA